MVGLCQELGADVLTQDANRETAISAAARAGSRAVLQLLLDHRMAIMARAATKLSTNQQRGGKKKKGRRIKKLKIND